MTNLFEEIMDLYSKQVDIISQFNEVSQQKVKILENNDTSMLNSIIKYEEALLMKFTAVENKRQRTLDIVKDQYGVKKITKRIMRKHLNGNQIKQADQLSKELNTHLEEQHKLKLLNMKIVETRLHELKSALDIIEKRSNEYLEPKVLLDKKV